MAICEVCGNDYDKAFQVQMGGESHSFDSFECAIHALAPRCRQCGVKVSGHGLEKDGQIFCCDHCAKAAGCRSCATAPERGLRAKRATSAFETS